MPAATKAVKVAKKRLSGNPPKSRQRSAPSTGAHRAKTSTSSSGHRATGRTLQADRRQLQQGFGSARRGASQGLTEAHRVTAPAHRQYSGVLFAEYLAGALLIMLGIFVGDDSYSTKMGRALLRLSALTAVFFVLALVASGENSGKFAAAFGGLIDVAILFDATKSGTIKNVGSVFSGNSATAGGGGTGGGGGDRAISYELPADEQDQHTILAG